MTIAGPSAERLYEVGLSFAGEDRAYVLRVAEALTERGVRPFYDEYAKAELWGKNLHEHLEDVYKNKCRYCVVFISEAYAKSVWTTLERQAAQSRALRDNHEYILPARFDKTSLPGLDPHSSGSVVEYPHFRDGWCPEGGFGDTQVGKDLTTGL